MQRAVVSTLIAAGLALGIGWGCSDDKKGPKLPDPICLTPGAGPYALSFTDVTDDLGLGLSGLVATGNNVSVADVDGDHWPDLLLTKSSNERENPDDPAGLYRLLRNTGGTGFEDWTWTSGLFVDRNGVPGRITKFVIFADVDNDGDADAFSVVWEDTGTGLLDDDTTLFFNDGSGGFTIGPHQSFTAGNVDPLESVAFLDYDHDGLLDVFVGHHYGTYGILASTIQDSLFAGDGQGNFADVTAAAGLETVPWTAADVPNGNTHKPNWGVTACDVDGDGWTDLMTASYGRQFNNFYRNRGDGTFEDLTLTSGFHVRRRRRAVDQLRGSGELLERRLGRPALAARGQQHHHGLRRRGQRRRHGSTGDGADPLAHRRLVGHDRALDQRRVPGEPFRQAGQREHRPDPQPCHELERGRLRRGDDGFRQRRADRRAGGLVRLPVHLLALVAAAGRRHLRRGRQRRWHPHPAVEWHRSDRLRPGRGLRRVDGHLADALG
jgi:hypothetical protein